MRLHTLTLALLVTAGCGTPCSERRAVVLGLGGPIGILVNAVDRCADADPTPSTRVAEAVPEVSDMASSPDMAAGPPDLAAHADMTPRPADMATRPPDMTTPPSCPRHVDVAFAAAAWMTNTASPLGNNKFQVAVNYDFLANRFIDGQLDLTVSLRDAVGAACLARTRQVAVSWSMSADLAWGAAGACRVYSTPGGSPGFLIKSGSTQACAEPYAAGGVAVGGTEAVAVTTGLASTWSTSSPPNVGTVVDAGGSVSLRARFRGDVLVTMRQWSVGVDLLY